MGLPCGLVRADFEIALQLASALDRLFENGDNDERRLLCETLFNQVKVSNGKIVKVELNPPFALIASHAEGSESLLSGQPIFASSVSPPHFFSWCSVALVALLLKIPCNTIQKH